MKRKYSGSCHCGAVRFEADVDLSAGTFRCNCSICSRTRFWPAVVTPDAFRLLAGESELTEYRFGAKQNQHFFCRHCGVRAFGVGNVTQFGKIIGVNVGCLEGLNPDELARLPITYIDGRNDRLSPPDVTAHL